MNLPYEDIVVVELGARIAAAACGRLLADLGAAVHVVEPRAESGEWKWADRASAVANKRSILADAASNADTEDVAALLERADVVILSSDVGGPLPNGWSAAIQGAPIVCDITAFGSSGPLAGRALAEQDLQALTGVVATTGLPEGPATPSAVPVLEMSGGLYAASAIGIALQVLRREGIGQRVEIALFDVGINTLTTFMPAHFAGAEPRRLGNGHGMAVPWNAYPAADGWVLLCSTNDSQWNRIAALVGPALSDEPRFAKLADRLIHRHEIDARLTAWTGTRALADVVAQLSAQGIPSGSIVTIEQLHLEPNVVARQSVAWAVDPRSGRRLRVPTPLIRFDGEGADAVTIPAADDGRSTARGSAVRFGRPGGRASAVRPLAGLRVIEIGQLTTAPLAARHLASFGADVIKVEPPGGESARYWAPLREGTSHFFVATNGEKRSVVLDLRSRPGLDRLIDLIRDADVLVENLKPGALAAMGLSGEALLALNPRLIYCAISGFGLKSAYKGRPAVDTVIQAMSGMMDATRCDGVPVKTGISAADIAGGQTGLLAIIAALARRERTGRGCVIDISMQDVGLWMTQLSWNAAPPLASPQAPILSVSQACTHPQTVARELITRRPDAAGRLWEVFASPMRLEKTPAQTGVLIGPPQAGEISWSARECAAAA
jgi:crotonobetainyl-CoA:carnitine CoA-transferase CaiB-like acyl-CoA transferase